MDFIIETRDIFTGWISSRKLERYLQEDFIEKAREIFKCGFHRGN